MIRARPQGPNEHARSLQAIDDLAENLDWSLISSALDHNSWAARCKLLDLADRARIYGARNRQVAELYGVSVRTLERWRGRRIELIERYVDKRTKGDRQR